MKNDLWKGLADESFFLQLNMRKCSFIQKNRIYLSFSRKLV